MFYLDALSRTPVYEQIISQFEEFVLRGVFLPGDKIPSVRKLSVELSINPNTIQKAYQELDRRGLTYSVPGKGVFVSESAIDLIKKNRRGMLDEILRITAKLKLADVSLEEVLETVRGVYREGDEKND